MRHTSVRNGEMRLILEDRARDNNLKNTEGIDMKKIVAIATLTLLFCSANAWAGPSTCAAAIMKLPGKTMNIVNFI